METVTGRLSTSKRPLKKDNKQETKQTPIPQNYPSINSDLQSKGSDTYGSTDLNDQTDRDVEEPNFRSSSCNRRGSKSCINICRSAYRGACRQNYCRRRMRRMFGKQCKRACKDEFKKDYVESEHSGRKHDSTSEDSV